MQDFYQLLNPYKIKFNIHHHYDNNINTRSRLKQRWKKENSDHLQLHHKHNLTLQKLYWIVNFTQPSEQPLQHRSHHLCTNSGDDELHHTHSPKIVLVPVHPFVVSVWYLSINPLYRLCWVCWGFVVFIYEAMEVFNICLFLFVVLREMEKSWIERAWWEGWDC